MSENENENENENANRSSFHDTNEKNSGNGTTDRSLFNRKRVTYGSGSGSTRQNLTSTPDTVEKLATMTDARGWIPICRGGQMTQTTYPDLEACASTNNIPANRTWTICGTRIRTRWLFDNIDALADPQKS